MQIQLLLAVLQIKIIRTFTPPDIYVLLLYNSASSRNILSLTGTLYNRVNPMLYTQPNLLAAIEHHIKQQTEPQITPDYKF